jgi:hypothetical protein
VKPVNIRQIAMVLFLVLPVITHSETVKMFY